ncbi:MAG: 4Fe-4S dicluster domain-containing protein [Cytophagaceae bacterium]
MNIKGANNSFTGNISEAVSSLLQGLKLTIRHFFRSAKTDAVKKISIDNPGYFDFQNGISTIQYPHESIPVPDNGRYRLHNEIDDCIVCDLCAKICPVNCIEIEPVKSTEEIGKTSDGTTKRIYAAKFDIDMAKCCYCGLCTTVCPTECLTMTKSYDYSEYDIRNMVYHFTDMSPEQVEEKKLQYEQKQKEKQKPAVPKAETPVKDTAAEIKSSDQPKPATAAPKPAFKPVIKKDSEKEKEKESEKESKKEDVKPEEEKPKSVAPKVVFKPVIKAPKPKTDPDNQTEKKDE